MAEFSKLLSSADLWHLTKVLKDCDPRATFELLAALNRGEPFDTVCESFSRLHAPTLNGLIAMQGGEHVCHHA